jgi:hypothetical protein
VSALAMRRPRSAARADSARFLCVDDVVESIGGETTSETTLYRELNAGLFPAIKIRSRWIVPSRAVVAMERAAQEFRTVVESDWDFGWDAEGGRFFKLAPAARLLTTSVATLKRDIVDGKFPAIKIRNTWVVPAKAIDAMERAALEGWTFVNASDWKITPGQTPAWATPKAVLL